MSVRMLLVAVGIFALFIARPQSGIAQDSPFRQASSSGSVVPVMLLLREDGHGPLVLRRRTEPRNVILVQAGATTPQQLAGAVRFLLMLERMDPRGSRRSDEAAAHVREVEDSHEIIAYPWVAEALDRLRASDPVEVAALGTHRAVQLWIPLDAESAP